jgi:serine/threonine protein kinase
MSTSTRRELGEALLQTALKGLIAAYAPAGTIATLLSEIAGPFAKAAYAFLSDKSPEDKQKAIDGLARMPPDRARELTLEQARGVFDEPTARALANYMAVVPATTRRAIAHPNDKGKPHTLLSQLPRREHELTKFLPIRPPLFQSGDHVPGRDYVLEALIGQGGFGEVWRARHRYSQALVAVKFCNMDGEAEQRIAALKNEMELVEALHARSSHDDGSPYIVELLETGLDNSTPFLIYEYIDGGDLSTWIAGFDGERPPVRDVVRCIKMMASGLVHAHARNVFHRDLKPANVLVARDGTVKITDFGIGALEKGGVPMDTATRAATALHGASTPMYADKRASSGRQYDIYSLGVITFQLLIGDVSREAGPAYQAELQACGVPARMISIVSRCLTIPQHRFGDVRELILELETPPPPWSSAREPVVDPGLHWRERLRKLAQAIARPTALGIGAVALWAFAPKPEGCNKNGDGDGTGGWGTGGQPTEDVLSADVRPEIDAPVDVGVDSPSSFEWMRRLKAPTCEAPCSAGSACRVTAFNVTGATGRCPDGNDSCTPCVSGLTCIPGEATAELGLGEPWQLHLSAVYETPTDAGPVNPCRTGRDFWICARPKAATATACVSQISACAQSPARSRTGIAVNGNDLLKDGIDIEVREGGRNGKLLAKRLAATYTTGLRRHGLCTGFKMSMQSQGGIDSVTFFLEPDL